MTHNKNTPTPQQAASRDQLIAQGYKVTGWEEYPTKSKRNPIEALLVLEKWTITPRSAGRCVAKVTPKGGIE